MLKYAILKKFQRKFFLYFGNNLRKLVIENFETVLSICQENYKTDFLGKFSSKFSINFGNNLRKQ